MCRAVLCWAGLGMQRWAALKAAHAVVIADSGCLVNYAYAVSKTALQEVRGCDPASISCK